MVDPLLEARALVKRYPLEHGVVSRLLSRGAGREVHAVDGVDMEVRRGEVFGLVGESGCGKTTLGRLLLRLVDPTSGTVHFDGTDITDWDESRLRPLRRRMQLVFQDPHASLNPAMTVGDAVAHPLLIHGLAKDGDEARERALRTFDEVGLARDLYGKRPADLSGGQKQRVVIARAVVTEPQLLVCDEPVSMLDMSVRARILELLLRLKEKRDLTLVFITHDLATAKLLCDRIAIMYLGQVVEQGDATTLLTRPEHPYARALLKAVPHPDPTARRAEAIARGEVPDATRPPAGCRFHPRCPVATPICGHEGRDLREVVEARTARLEPHGRDDVLLQLGSPLSWKMEGHDVLVGPAQEGAEAALERLVQDERRVVWDAKAGVAREGRNVRVAFRPPADMDLRARPAGRIVRCVLYPDVTGKDVRVSRPYP